MNHERAEEQTDEDVNINTQKTVELVIPNLSVRKEVTRNYYVHPFISDLCIILVSEIIWRSEQCVRYIRNAKMYLQTSLIS